MNDDWADRTHEDVQTLTIATVLIYQIAANGSGSFGERVVMGAILWFSIVLGNRLGYGIDDSGVDWWSMWHPSGWISAFRAYLDRYGLQFVSALLVGVYIGWWLDHRAPWGRDRGPAAPPAE